MSRQIVDPLLESFTLKNLQLRHLDILDAERELGEFDYIVSHGVFSWVPPRVQAAGRGIRCRVSRLRVGFPPPCS